MDTEIVFLFVALIVTLIIGVFLYLFYLLLRRFFRFWQRTPPPARYTPDKPSTWYQHLRFEEPIPFLRGSATYDAQVDNWKITMQSIAQHLTQNRVRAVFLTHGTFVGHDPVGFLAVAKGFYPGLSQKFERRLEKLIKLSSDRLVRDAGNFLPAYIQILNSALGGAIECFRFNWSSGNHHLARLVAAARLGEELAAKKQSIGIGGRDRILLVGHSHAGQVFALLSQLMEGGKNSDFLIDRLCEYDFDRKELINILVQARSMNLDFVTLGTPPRYNWAARDAERLLNIVNHRGSSHQAGRLSGILTTRDGDYVQQFGIIGTDIPAPTQRERAINRSLDSVLGTGIDGKAWSGAMKHRMRVPSFGRTLLVDYQDGSNFRPNFIATFFGHGVYTRYESMLFTFRKIVEYLY